VERLPGESDAGVGHLRAFGSDRRGLATSDWTVPALAQVWQGWSGRAGRSRRCAPWPLSRVYGQYE
jgi:hypothetical protein